MQITFIVKKKEDSYGSGIETGLYNSAKMMADALNASFELAIDGNCIDRIVTENKTGIAILEALWVTPIKLQELQQLHPNIKWVVRLHSDTPFIATEGIAIDWITAYSTINNVYIAPNDPRLYKDLIYLLGKSNIVFLPNYYKLDNVKGSKISKDEIHIGCLGAIRPMKNTLRQAIASIQFADSLNKTLFFYVNSRVEQNGNPVLHNIQALFEKHPKHNLITLDWMNRDKLIETCSHLDIGMQVSMSETYNIVAADFISANVPIVTSNEVPWASMLSYAECNSTEDIVDSLERTYKWPWMNVKFNRIGINSYNKESLYIWNKFIGSIQ